MVQIKPLAVFFADAHLDIHKWRDRPELKYDSMHAFSYICKWAIDHRVSDIFGAGDLVDVREPHSSVIRFVRDEMEQLYCKRVKFWYIQGQHGWSNPPWLEAAHHWPQWLHQDAAVIDGNYEVYGLDWQPADVLEDELVAMKERQSHILLCHQVWEEFMGSHGQPEGSWTQIPSVDAVFTGDYHKTEHIKDFKYGASGQPLEILSPGSTNIREISEDPKKYFFVLYDGFVWKKVRIPTRMVIRNRIEEEIEFEELIANWSDTMDMVREHNVGYYESWNQDDLPELLRKPILQLVFSDGIKKFRSRAKSLLAEEAHLFFKVIEEEGDDDEHEELVARRKIIERGIEGCLELTVPKNDKRYAPLLRLIKAKDKKAELLKMKEERFGSKTEQTAAKVDGVRRGRGGPTQRPDR